MPCNGATKFRDKFEEDLLGECKVGMVRFQVGEEGAFGKKRNQTKNHWLQEAV